MAIRTKIDPVELVTATLSAELALPEARRAAAAFAREGIEEAARTNQRILGRRPRHVDLLTAVGMPLLRPSVLMAVGSLRSSIW